MFHHFDIRDMKCFDQLARTKKLLRRHLMGQCQLSFLEFLPSKLRGIQAARDQGVDIAADDSAERHGHHDPERHSRYTAEFERCVKRDNDGSGDAQDDVKIEPVRGGADAGKPAPPFSKIVKVNYKKHTHTEHPELYPNRTAGAKQCMLRRKGPRAGAKRVVIEAIGGNGEQEGDGDGPSSSKPQMMGGISVRHRSSDRSYGRVRCHCDGNTPTSSLISVLYFL